MEKAELDARVLVYAPLGRDAPAAAEFIRRAELHPHVCESLEALVAELARGACAVLLAEEGLFRRDAGPLVRWVAAQPAWSDLPFVVLTSHQEGQPVRQWRTSVVADLRNVSLLERPIQTITLTSAIRAASRARARQYQVRALMQAQAEAAQALEAQVALRTAELEQANSELLAQIAERSRAEDALRQAQKLEAIGQLTGGVAHDFNNLLMVISGGLEMLERLTDASQRSRLLDRMQQAAQRGSALTRQLLAFSRRSTLKPQVIDLERQIGATRELLDRSLRGDVHVDLDFQGDLWPVAVDPGELELVILNLAVNARDAMPEGGTIRIRAENAPGAGADAPDGDFVRLSVIDAGTGMTEEVKAHVFEPFFTTKEVGRGSGLGLAQVHGFAAQSGGAVEIQTTVGRGTTVTLLLPRAAGAPAPHQGYPSQAPAPARVAVGAGSVLVVEDDSEVGALAAEMLEHLGYRVTRAASASAALGALSNGRAIDLVFSDIMMPGGMSGVDLAREIRRRRGDLPILLTSGYAEAARESAAAEGLRVLPKPYRIEELAAAVATIMAAEGVGR